MTFSEILMNPLAYPYPVQHHANMLFYDVLCVTLHMKNMKHMKHHLTNVAFVFLIAACNLGLLVTELCIAIIALRRHTSDATSGATSDATLHAYTSCIRYATSMSWSGP